MKRETNHNNILGRRGEDIAAAFLREKGMTILAQNWRSGHLEVDLICAKGQEIHFIEVKTRREPVEGHPWEAVTPAKMQRLCMAAKNFLHSEKCHVLPFRVEESHFDIVSVVFAAESDEYSTEYIPDAFVPGVR